MLPLLAEAHPLWGDAGPYRKPAIIHDKCSFDSITE